MSTEHLISVDDNGRLWFIYSDELAFLSELGEVEIRRASHVEPAPDGKWYSEMIGGPTLGPFDLRQQALDAEVEWLQNNIL